MTINQENAEKLFRYEALFELVDAIGSGEDLCTIARLLRARWKYLASVSHWHLVVSDAPGYVVLNSEGNPVQDEVYALCAWDQHFWQARHTYSFGSAPADTEPPAPVSAAAPMLIIPIRHENKETFALLTINVRDGQSSKLDLKFINMLAKRAAERIYDIRLRKRATSLLLYRASHDALTQILNRGAVLEQMSRQMLLSQRTHKPLSVLMVDIDYFKSINDTYGHQAGDAVLIDVCSRLRRNVRDNELIGRYGGEEILIVLYPCNGSEALHVAERMRRLIYTTPFSLPEHASDLTVSVSIGIATSKVDDDNATLISRADKALYQAIAAGRNCVCIITDTEPPHTR